MIQWNYISSDKDIDSIKDISNQHPVLIFKHSTRCSISSAAKDRLERNWNEKEASQIQPYFLDLLKHRDISERIAQEFGVAHESPQIILVKDGKAFHNNSHMAISFSDVISNLG